MTQRYLPVFIAQWFSDETSEEPAKNQYIELTYPNTQVIPITGEPPYGWDGCLVFREPPTYPCIVATQPIQHPNSIYRYHVPNRVLENEYDWVKYQAEFQASIGWTYIPGGDPEQNIRAREANKSLRDMTIRGLRPQF